MRNYFQKEFSFIQCLLYCIMIALSRYESKNNLRRKFWIPEEMFGSVAVETMSAENCWLSFGYCK